MYPDSRICHRGIIIRVDLSSQEYQFMAPLHANSEITVLFAGLHYDQHAESELKKLTGPFRD